MRVERIFRGTILDFVNEVAFLCENIREDAGYLFIDRVAYQYRRPEPGETVARVSFGNPNEDDSARFGSITAVALPENQSRLEVWADDQYWAYLKPYWKKLESRIRPFLVAKPKGTPGAPWKDWNVWAWYQVNEDGRDKEAVYPEWCAMNPDSSGLANAKSSFDHAVAPDRNPPPRK